MISNCKKAFLIINLAFLFLCGASTTMAQAVDDETIAAKITAAINRDKVLDGLPISVVSVNGFILLTGQALNAEQKKQATQTTAFARQPIRRLINEMVIVEAIDISSAEADAELHQKITDEISSLTTNTTVVVHAGMVHLLGALSKEEAGLVADKVSRIAGVQGIKLSFEVAAQ